MALQPALLEQSQRIQVELESYPTGRCVKIRVEHFDERLGWYSSGSLSLPLRQLPLLEQAVAEMRKRDRSEAPSPEKIIPFPGAAKAFAG